MPNKRTQSTVHRARAAKVLRDQDFTYRQIAEALQIKVSYAYDLVNHRDENPKQRDKWEVMALLHEVHGWSYAQIAKLFRCTRQSVHQLIAYNMKKIGRA